MKRVEEFIVLLDSSPPFAHDNLEHKVPPNVGVPQKLPGENKECSSQSITTMFRTLQQTSMSELKFLDSDSEEGRDARGLDNKPKNLRIWRSPRTSSPTSMRCSRSCTRTPAQRCNVDCNFCATVSRSPSTSADPVSQLSSPSPSLDLCNCRYHTLGNFLWSVKSHPKLWAL